MKIVLSRLDRLGDLILSTPAIRSMRRSFPEARLTLVCSRYNEPVVRRNPDIDELYVGGEDEKPQDIGRRYLDADIAVALAPRTQDILLVAATRAKRRIGYTYVRRYGTRVMARFKLSETLISDADPELCDRNPERPVRHEVEQLLELARHAGASRIERELVLPLDEREAATYAHIPAGNITIHLAARWLSTGSTEASFLALLDDLRTLGRPIVVTYASDMADVASRIGTLADVLVGDLSFDAWTAVLARAACVVTVDTGATHVASAMGRPTVVLFEHRHFHLNSREWAPWQVPSAVLRKPAGDSEEELLGSRKDLVAAVGRLIAA